MAEGGRPDRPVDRVIFSSSSRLTHPISSDLFFRYAIRR